MKRFFIITLALLFVLGMSGTVFAGPFADVPAKHWAYEAVNQLAKDGIVQGYGDGTFRGDRPLTRYEMAIVVAKAMEHADKASAADRALINKLSAEFSQELKTLGVRVTNLEDRVSTLEKVTFNGDVRLRGISYDDTIGGASSKATFWQTRARINFQDQIADNGTFYARFAVRNSFGQSTSAGYQAFDQYGVKYNMNDWKFVLGRQSINLGQGLILSTGDDAEWDHKFDGLVASTKAGNVNFKFIAGKTTTSNTVDSALGGLDTPTEWYGVEVGSQIDKVWSLGAAYAHAKPDKISVTITPIPWWPWCSKTLDLYGADRNYWSVNTTLKFNDQFSVNGEYAKSNAANFNRAYFAGATYSWDKDSFNAQYQKVEINALDAGNSGYSWIGFPFWGTNLGLGSSFSGWQYTYNHPLSKATSMMLLYFDVSGAGLTGRDKEGCLQFQSKF